MPCENCDPASVASGFEPYYILYTGGPAIAQYLALRLAIPARDERVVLRNGWPSIHDDGYLVYSGGQVPPVPEGWERITDTIFRPVWSSCSRRALRAQMTEDGSLRVEGVCTDARAGHLNKAVKLDACQECSYRQGIKGGSTGGSNGGTRGAP